MNRVIKTIGSVIAVVIVAAAIVGLLFVLPSAGSREISELETIHGISYPEDTGSILVLEKLAHADIYLQESVFARQLRLTFEFQPGNATEIHVGVRENSFWLSYPKHEVYAGENVTGWQTREIVIPLTDKLQESNRSIDIMFFASTPSESSAVDEGEESRVQWQIRNLAATVEPVAPSPAQVKDFVRAVVKQERAL